MLTPGVGQVCGPGVRWSGGLAADTITTDAAPRLTGLALVLLTRLPGWIAATGPGTVPVPLPVELG